MDLIVTTRRQQRPPIWSLLKRSSSMTSLASVSRKWVRLRTRRHRCEISCACGTWRQARLSSGGRMSCASGLEPMRNSSLSQPCAKTRSSGWVGVTGRGGAGARLNEEPLQASGTRSRSPVLTEPAA